MVVLVRSSHVVYFDKAAKLIYCTYTNHDWLRPYNHCAHDDYVREA